MSSPSGQNWLFPELAGAPTLREVAATVRLAGVEGLTEAVRRADDARYQDVRVKSALTETRGMPFRWALNPYRGCTHACAYCFARKYQRHLELDTGDAFSSVIFVKRDLPAVLRRELGKASWSRETVALGTATDPYQPIEGQARITRQCLDVLIEATTPFSIVTKGPLVVRDIDLLVRATEGAGCRVFMSVPSVDEDAWSRLEPGTASPAQRLRAVRELALAGIDASVLMMPLVPGITTSRASITRTVAAIADAGVTVAGAGVAHLEDGVRGHFFAFLEREYPQLVAGYARLYTQAYVPKDYRDQVSALVAKARSDTDTRSGRL